ncbi:hypothetical protein N9K85_01685 [Flavobacteriaceae bacterium]|nr:hypothetical protein [Flavobacteriaceae bacterium]
MAGAKESPRQKMINLMYLVFIAMLALNMSKEVLTAFGQITEQVEENNISLIDRIGTFEETIEMNYNSEGQQEVWAEKKWAKDEINEITSKFITHLDALPDKNPPKKEVKGRGEILDYEVMDKSEYYDKKFFLNSAADAKLTEEGEEFVTNVRDFRTNFDRIIDSLLVSDENNLDYKKLKDEIDQVFNPDDQIIDSEGIKRNWMELFHGYPEVTTNTRLAMMKSNALSFKAQLLSFMIGGQYKVNATLANFDAYVVSERNAYFPGSKFQGKIILGKKSKDLKPKSVKINDNDIDPKESLDSDGAIVLDFPVGRVGTNKIQGTVFFEEKGEIIPITVDSEYDVISKPNTASVEVVGRNTLFRNYPNDVIISVPGIPSNSIKLSTNKGEADIISKGNGQYTINPKGRGKDISILVSGTFSNGETFSDPKNFVVRNPPKPEIYFNNKQTGVMSKANIRVGKVTGVYPPAYGLSASVRITSFKVKIAKREFTCSGNTLSPEAKAYLRKTPAGFNITILDVLYAGLNSGTKPLGPSITIR